MFTFLLVLLIIDSFVLIAAILLQSGKGSGLAASFGGVSSSADSLLGTRQAGNLLTRTSWWGGGIFLVPVVRAVAHVDAPARAEVGARSGRSTQPPRSGHGAGDAERRQRRRRSTPAAPAAGTAPATTPARRRQPKP